MATSALNAFLESAVTGETLGGTAGGIAGMAMAGLLIPEPTSTILGGLTLVGMSLLGGIGGSIGGRKVEEALSDPVSLAERDRSRAESQEKYPKSSFAGQFLPDLAAFKPSAKVGKTILSGLISPNPQAKRAALNVFGGGAITGGIETGRQIVTGEEVDPARIGIATIAGTTLHQPRKYLQGIIPKVKSQGEFLAKDIVGEAPTGLKEERIGAGQLSKPLTSAQKAVARANQAVGKETRASEIKGRLKELTSKKPDTLPSDVTGPTRIPQQYETPYKEYETKLGDIQKAKETPGTKKEKSKAVKQAVKEARMLDEQYRGLFSRAKEQELISIRKSNLKQKLSGTPLSPDDVSRIRLVNRVLEGKGFAPGQTSWDMSQLEPVIIEDFGTSSQKLTLGPLASEQNIVEEATQQWVKWLVDKGPRDQQRVVSKLLKNLGFDKDPDKAIDALTKLVADKTFKQLDNLDTPTTDLLKQLRTKVKESMSFPVSDDQLSDLLAYRNTFDAPQVSKIPFKGTAFSIEAASLDPKERKASIISRYIRPAVTNVSKKFPTIGKALENFFVQHRVRRGQWSGGLIRISRIAKREKKMSAVDIDASLQRIMKHTDDIAGVSDRGDGTTNINLTPNDLWLRDKIAKEIIIPIGKIRNQLPNLYSGDLKGEKYMPRTISGTVYRVMAEGDDASKAKLWKDLDKYWRNKGVPEEMLGELKIAMRNALTNPEQMPPNVRFKALRKASGHGVPDSWVEKDPFKRLQMYTERSARAISYEETVAPHAKALVEVTGDPDVKATLKFINGYDRDDFETFSNLAKSLSMGPTTGLTDIITSPFLGLQHMTFGQIAKTYFNPFYWGRFGKGWNKLMDDTFVAGINRQNSLGFEYMDEGLTSASMWMAGLRDNYNKGTGREFMEKTSRALTYYQGKNLAQNYFTIAKRNPKKLSKTAKRFVDEWIPNEAIQRGYLEPDELMRAAAAYTESVQGTYDPRGLSAWMLDGLGKGLTSYPRWSINKFNNFIDYVIKPAYKEGNLVPLILMTAGAGVAGTAVEHLRSFMGGRKRRTPSWDEIVSNYDGNEQQAAEGVGYKLLAIAEASGYTGMAMDMLKKSYEAYQGLRPVDEAFIGEVPALMIVEDTMVTLSQAALASQKGELNVADDLWGILEELFARQTQSWRVAKAQIIKAGMAPGEKAEIERKEAARDLRTWKYLNSYPTSPFVSVRNNALATSAKDFKRAPDIQSAMQAATKVPMGSPGMKQMTNPYAPSMNASPMEFMKYMNSLPPDVRAERMNQYIMEQFRIKQRQAVADLMWPISGNQEMKDALGPEQAAKMDKAYQQHLNLNP